MRRPDRFRDSCQCSFGAFLCGNDADPWTAPHLFCEPCNLWRCRGGNGHTGPVRSLDA